MAEKKLRFETRQIHSGYHVDQTGSRGVAIYPTAAYHFRDCDHAARLFELSEGGNIYTRLQNPTSSAYEERIAALYGGVGALAVSSGMSAILLTITSLAEKGQNIVTSPFLYGGTYNQFKISLRKLGIECRIAPQDSIEAMEALIDENTRAVYVESMGNPTCDVPDLERIAQMAHRHDVPFVVKCRVDGLRDLGCCPSSFDSYLMLIGLETLSLRVDHEVRSAWRLAEYCRNHPKVRRVSFVGFEDHAGHVNAKKYFRHGSSSVFTIELEGTLDTTIKFVESLKLFAHMTMIGDSISVVTHPASTTHKQLSDEDKIAAGVTPTLLRISMGLENVEDLIDDFEQAFAAIG
jgi:O-acetylhomoserine/O-acetylserine sulfhydrylase-like pyridoxal-dependent enzyme